METEEQMNERLQKANRHLKAYHNLRHGPIQTVYSRSMSGYIIFKLN